MSERGAKKGATKRGAAKGGATKGSAAKGSAAKQAASGKTERSAGAEARRHWLIKSEPDVFSFDDLMAAPRGTTCWDGVRNYQARNFMRDEMKVGDRVLFYHSGAEPPGVAGVAEVARAAYPDHSAFDPADPHHDPKSRADAPTWMMVDVRAVERFPRLVTLAELRATPGLEEMALLQRGSRLSVQPVTPEEFEIVRRLGLGE